MTTYWQIIPKDLICLIGQYLLGLNLKFDPSIGVEPIKLEEYFDQLQIGDHLFGLAKALTDERQCDVREILVPLYGRYLGSISDVRWVFQRSYSEELRFLLGLGFADCFLQAIQTSQVAYAGLWRSPPFSVSDEVMIYLNTQGGCPFTAEILHHRRSPTMIKYLWQRDGTLPFGQFFHRPLSLGPDYQAYLDAQSAFSPTNFYVSLKAEVPWEIQARIFPKVNYSLPMPRQMQLDFLTGWGKLLLRWRCQSEVLLAFLINCFPQLTLVNRARSLGRLLAQMVILTPLRKSEWLIPLYQLLFALPGCLHPEAFQIHYRLAPPEALHRLRELISSHLQQKRLQYRRWMV